MLRTYLAIYTLAWCLKILWDRSCGYSGAVRIDLEDYFDQKWSQTMSGLHINSNCMLVDLPETDSGIDMFATKF